MSYLPIYDELETVTHWLSSHDQSPERRAMVPHVRRLAEALRAMTNHDARHAEDPEDHTEIRAFLGGFGEADAQIATVLASDLRELITSAEAIAAKLVGVPVATPAPTSPEVVDLAIAAICRSGLGGAWDVVDKQGGCVTIQRRLDCVQAIYDPQQVHPWRVVGAGQRGSGATLTDALDDVAHHGGIHCFGQDDIVTTSPDGMFVSGAIHMTGLGGYWQITDSTTGGFLCRRTFDNTTVRYTPLSTSAPWSITCHLGKTWFGASLGAALENAGRDGRGFVRLPEGNGAPPSTSPENHVRGAIHLSGLGGVWQLSGSGSGLAVTAKRTDDGVTIRYALDMGPHRWSITSAGDWSWSGPTLALALEAAARGGYVFAKLPDLEGGA